MADDHSSVPEPEFALTVTTTTATAKTTTTLEKTKKPHLAILGTRVVPSDGRWHPGLCAEYIRDHGGRTRMMTVGEIARVFFSGNNQSNRVQVRRRLHKVWQILLSWGELLVVEMDTHNGAQALKLYDPHSPSEIQYLEAKIARMHHAQFLKADQLQRALQLRECIEQAAAPLTTTTA